MKNLWPTRSYIDLFAGPGLCYNYQRKREVPGSPIFALKSLEPFTYIHLVELNKKIREILKERIRIYRPENNKTKVLVYPGDCNEKVEQIRKRLSHNSLDLAFLDPEGFELHFQTIRSLTEGRRMDLIINFPTSGIRRNTRNMAAEDSSLLDGLVPGWKEVYSKPFTSEKVAAQAILGHFKELLEKIGYKKIERGDQISVFSSGTRVHLYDLIFATKHSRGEDFWKKVARRASHGEQGAFKFL